MVDENLAEKCRRWVEEYAGQDRPSRNSQHQHNLPREVRNWTERCYEIPTCWFERPSWISTDYHLLKITNVEAEINVKSRLGKFDVDSLDEMVGQFGEFNIAYGYLLLPRLFCLITGREPAYYLDENAETHLESLLSQLKENAIRKAESIGTDLIVIERDEINVRVDFSGLVHLATILLGCEYSFRYNADARAEFYRRKI